MQSSIVGFLKKTPNKWFSTKEISLKIGYNMGPSLTKLRKWNFIEYKAEKTGPRNSRTYFYRYVKKK